MNVNKEPLISIVVPFYNVYPYFDECLSSIKNQTYKNIEVILINDGSTDDSLNIANSFASEDERFIIFNNNNSGISFSRNFGISVSKGEYISFIDSDDYVANDYIESLLTANIIYNTSISLCAHNILLSDSKVIPYGCNISGKYDTKTVISNILLDKGMDLSPWGKLYKKDYFKDIEYPNGHLFEDSACTCKILMKTDYISFISEPKYFYRKRYNSITTAGSFSKKMDLINYTEEMSIYITNSFPELFTACKRRLVWAYFSTLNQLIKAPDMYSYKNEKNKILSFLLKNKKEILTGNVYSKKDKLAIVLLSMGISFYKHAWHFYLYFTGRTNN